MLNYITGIDLRAKPILLQIELTSHCNLKCIMCPNEKMVRKRGYLDLSLFKKVVDQTIDTAWEYSFNMLGEPTIHPNFVEMCEYVKNKGGRVAVYTNMNYQDETINDYFVRSSIDRMVVNMCTIDAGTYKTITKGGDYNVFIHNLAMIKEGKERLKKKLPIVVGSFLKMKLNVGELNKEKEQFKKYFDYYMVLEMHDWAGDKDVAALKSLEKVSRFKRRCSNLRTTVGVLWDGRVVACCYDYEGKVIFGDAKVDKIYDIWNCSGTRQFRKKHRSHDLCKNCEERMRSQFSIENLFSHIKINLKLK